MWKAESADSSSIRKEGFPMITISSSPDKSVLPAEQSSSAAAPARKQQSSSSNVSDAVQFRSDAASIAGLVQPTLAQKVQQLYWRGNTVPQITFNLDLSAQAVDRYLNISQAK
jgi:hypothetical protein